MDGLMHLCTNWGFPGCYPDVSKLQYPKEHKEGKEISILPSGEELRKLDEICKKCESSHFKVSKKECPNCDSVEVGTTGASFIAGTINEIELECYKWGLKFWISKSIYKP